MEMYSNIKEAIDLRGFLEENGVFFRKVGAYFRSDTCPCCGEGATGSNRVGIEGNGLRWRCFACGKGGDVLDAASFMWGVSIKDAAQKLAAERWVPMSQPITRTVKVVTKDTQPMVSEVLKRMKEGLKPDIPDPEVLQYLSRDRAIPMPIIRKAFQLGMLRFLPSNPLKARTRLEDVVGRELLEEAGMWNPEKKMPAAAYRPIIFFLPGESSAEFRLGRAATEGERKAIRYGSSERPWYWEGDGSKPLAIVEGAIDMLSMVALGYKGDVMGLPGASVWKEEWFMGASSMIVCLDPDKAGIKATSAILEVASRYGISAIDKAPPEGRDVNDELRFRIAA